MKQLLSLVAALAFSLPALGQIPGLSLKPAASSSATSSASSSSALAAPQAISVDQIVLEAEEDTSRVHEMTGDLDDDETVKDVAAELVPLTKDSTTHLTEVRRILAARPSVAAIHALEPGWREIAGRADEATHDLTRRATQATKIVAELDRLDATWSATQKAAQAGQAPAAVTDRISEVLALIAKTRVAAASHQTEVLALQAKSSAIEARANDVLDQLATASQRATSQLLVRDSLPVWSGGFWSSAIAAMSTQGSESLRNQFDDLATYLGNEPEEAGLHLLLLIVLVILLYIARSKARQFAGTEPEKVQAVRVFEAPIATALLLASFMGYWFYSDPPQLLLKLLSLIGIVPTVLVVRRLIDRFLHPILYGLGGFYFIDQIRTVVAVSAPIARLVFVIEILGGLVFLIWLAMYTRARSERPWTETLTWRALRVLSVIGVAFSCLVLIANFVGYQGLSTLLGAAMLRGAYLALLLYAVTRVAQGVTLGLFHVGPLTYLAMVRQHRRMLTDRVTLAISLAAAWLWIYALLRNVGFWDEAGKNLAAVLDANLTVGSFAISLGKVLGFVVALFVATWTARFVNFILDEEVYPKINLARGLPYVISTMLRYAIIFVGLVIGLASLGIDMTKFTILAGAFSVGLGFGMQNIVNNFVSGLIVLFERPVKVGDVVQFGDIIGKVERIGIRASIIRAANGAEIIIPNGTLISNNVTNWTFSTKTRRVDVPIQAALAADPADVKKILLEVASHVKGVAETPPPQALLTQLGPDALTFELRVWTDASSDWASMKSDLTSSITDELRKAGIAFK